MRKAFTTAYEHIRLTLLRRAAAMLGSDDDAADALHDAFYRLWRQRSHDPGQLEAAQVERMAAVSVRNACIDTLRVRNTRFMVEAEAGDVADTEADSGNDVRDELFAEIKEIINSSLSERDRKILYMRDCDGCEYEEIARCSGLSEANIRMILSRARRKVRDLYYERQQQHNRPR